jgi:carbamoyl-phosphate synthase large subunit
VKVLVTGAGAVLGQGIIRSLQSTGTTADVVAVDPSPLSAGLYWTPRTHVIRMASDPAYLDRLGEVVRQEQPDAILIGTDVELRILAAGRESLERDWKTRIVVSPLQTIDIADDKYLTYRFLREKGFAVPESCLPGGEEELLDTVGYPLIVKPRVGARAVGVSMVRNRAELRDALRIAENPVIQECVGSPDEEYTAGVVVFDGAARASIVMRRDLRDGNTYRAYVEEYPQLNDDVRALAESLPVFGPINFQFRLGQDGRPRVFEINARFSGTTPLRALAGFDEVMMVLRHVLHGEAVIQPTVRPMILLRHWSETVVEPGHLVSVPDADVS